MSFSLEEYSIMNLIPSDLLADLWIFTNFQLIMIVALIALIVFYVQYKKKQM